MNAADPDPLREQIAALPREITPVRDLWPEIQARVEQLAPRTLAPAEPSTWRSARAAARRFRLPLAAAAGLVIAALGWWRAPAGPSWSVAAVSGAPRVGHRPVPAQARLRIGQWLETDASSTARIEVGGIGEVRLEPNSRLRLVNAAATDHRLQLERGRLAALIWAPPRLFFVETPSATAIDLGCAYTLTVDDRGVGVIEVTAGYVALEHAGRESVVPAGLSCLTHPGSGPGTPFATDATAEFRTALNRFDAGDRTALDAVVTAAGSADVVTLWHLLARAPETARGAVFDKLASLQPAPGGVTREGIVAGDAAMRDRWAPGLGLLASAVQNNR